MKAIELYEHTPSVSSLIMPIVHSNIDESSISKVVDAINEKCSQFLGMVDPVNDVLYRGFDRKSTHSSPLAFYFDGKRENRKPLSTPNAFHQKVIKMINSAGLVANRDNGWFATGDRNEAYGYGEVYVVFPKNGFHYTWSRYIGDLYADYDEASMTDERMDAFMEKIKASYEGDNGTLKEAIHSGNEIMFTSDTVIMVNPDFYHKYIAANLNK